MLDPVSAAQSLRWLLPELALIVGWLLVRLLEHSRDLSFLTAARLAPVAALTALLASFAIPFEATALAGDLLRADATATLAIRIVLITTTLALVLGAGPDLLVLALAACLAARTNDTLMMVVVLQFLLLASVLVSLRAPGRRLTDAHAPAREDLAAASIGVTLVAAAAALLLGATSQTAFGAIGVALAHRESLSGWITVAALVPVVVLAYRIGATPRTIFRATDGRVEPGDVAALVIVATGLLMLLLRWIGTALGGDTGTAATTAVRTLPWRPIVAFLALVPMARGTLIALTADRTELLHAGLIESQVGWLLAGAASDTIRGADAAMIALIVAVPACLAVTRPSSGDHPRGVDPPPATPPSHLALLATVVLLVSLAGLPGTAGFVGRWSLVKATRTGASWWLIMPGVLLWAMNFVAILRWSMTKALQRDASVTRVGMTLSLVVLAGALGAPMLHALLADVFPFP